MHKPAALLLVLAFSSSFLFAQNPEPKQVEIYSHKIVYLEAGSGPPVILLHGLGASKGVWGLTIPALAPKLHVYALDLIGFGDSDKPLIKYRVATYSDFLNEFMRKLNIPKASIVGNSLGGWIAADFAIRYPERVDRAVLVGAAGLFTRPIDASSLNPGSLEETRQLVKRVFFNKQMQNDAFVAMVFAERMRAGDAYTIDRILEAAGKGEDLLNDRLGSVRAPVLVVHGRMDPLIPLADGEAIAAQIPGAKKVILDDCGHVPEFECPVPFAKAVLDFLSVEIK